MREIGVRALKAQMSSVLRAVEAGERLAITRRGRAVAELVPIGSGRGGAADRLIAEGRVTPASRPMPKDPPAPRRTGRSASAVILAERDEQR